MARRITLVFILLLVASLLAGVAPAFAAEEEHGGHGEEISFTADWLPRLVNFGILAVFLFVALRKTVRDFFSNRAAEIAKSLQESREGRERAAAALAEMDRKVREIGAETNRLIDDARARGEQDRQQLLEEGRKVAADVQAQVKTAIDTELQKAKADLAVEASLLAVDLAESSVKDAIKKQDHDRILKEYIDAVGGRE
jgi:F-type H+-transporting ATPase subunit b